MTSFAKIEVKSVSCNFASILDSGLEDAFVLANNVAQPPVITVDSAGCADSGNFIVSGNVWNVETVPIHVWEVTGSFYDQSGKLVSTGSTSLSSPIISPGDSSSFTLTSPGQVCNQIYSYHLETTSLYHGP